MTRELRPTDYQRTRMIGFSVTHSWWDEFYASISNPSAWELRWYSGGSVDEWANSNSPAWTYSGDPVNTGGLINPVGGSDNEAAVDRVIFNVSGLTPALHPDGGYSSNTAEWKFYIGFTLTNIRDRHPNVRMILLQPNIAGPAFGTCPTNGTLDTGGPHGDYPTGWSAPYQVIRCTYTQPYIASACASLSRGNVRMGYAPAAPACADFRDWAGHLQTSAESAYGVACAAYYDAHL